MTGSQKVIKVVSILVIIVAILSILLGLASCVGGFAGVAASSGVSESEQETLALGAGVLFFLGGGAIISGVIDLIVGILGLRGAKDPKRIGGFSPSPSSGSSSPPSTWRSPSSPPISSTSPRFRRPSPSSS